MKKSIVLPIFLSQERVLELLFHVLRVCLVDRNPNNPDNFKKMAGGKICGAFAYVKDLGVAKEGQTIAKELAVLVDLKLLEESEFKKSRVFCLSKKGNKYYKKHSIPRVQSTGLSPLTDREHSAAIQAKIQGVSMMSLYAKNAPPQKDAKRVGKKVKCKLRKKSAKR